MLSLHTIFITQDSGAWVKGHVHQWHLEALSHTSDAFYWVKIADDIFIGGKLQ